MQPRARSHTASSIHCPAYASSSGASVGPVVSEDTCYWLFSRLPGSLGKVTAPACRLAVSFASVKGLRESAEYHEFDIVHCDAQAHQVSS